MDHLFERKKISDLKESFKMVYLYPEKEILFGSYIKQQL
jgi:hypothetical protein